jgi:hypothetical protein
VRDVDAELSWDDPRLIIHQVTRGDLLADGSLIAVPEKVAREAGFRVSVALTAAAWADCVAWDDEDTERHGVPQDEDGRLWDVLWMARAAARRAAQPGVDGPVTVVLRRVPRDGRGRTARRAALWLLLHQGDDGEPVFTISQVGED